VPWLLDAGVDVFPGGGHSTVLLVCAVRLWYCGCMEWVHGGCSQLRWGVGSGCIVVLSGWRQLADMVCLVFGASGVVSFRWCDVAPLGACGVGRGSWLFGGGMGRCRLWFCRGLGWLATATLADIVSVAFGTGSVASFRWHGDVAVMVGVVALLGVHVAGVIWGDCAGGTAVTWQLAVCLWGVCH
jgi:hypothetical protein